MTNELLADIVMWFHVAFTAFIFVGFGIGSAWRRFMIAYIVIMIAALGLQLWLGACPLTLLEEHLRGTTSRPVSYRGSFLAYYLKQWTGIEVPPQRITQTLVVLVACMFVGLWACQRRRPK